MNNNSIIGLIIIFAFYGSYFVKMFAQSKKSIKTDRMGKGGKPKKTSIIEIILKISTFLTVIIQFISIIFISAMVTMRDSWRAGIDRTQKTKIINTGIYRYSRNPAFVGFDLLYIGMGLAFSNILNLIFACFSILVLHFQILEEEKFLPVEFGQDYLDYKSKARRYFGKRGR